MDIIKPVEVASARHKNSVPLTPEAIDGYLKHLQSAGRELLNYAERMGIRSGPIFLTRSGKALDRTYAAQSIRRLCPTAQVPEEKGSPRCLRKLYRATRADMEHSIALLVEQAQDRLLEEEQLAIGWDR